MSKRIVLIGAGSASFTRGLLADIIASRELAIGEIRLVDIDPDALGFVEKLANRMLQGRRDDIRVLASTDRRDLLPGADVIVTTIAAGGRKGWAADVEIPRKYGCFQPVGDSVGPGGWSRALRHVPIIEEVARDIEDLCPEAWFFNYSNPMSCNTRAMFTVRSGKCAGLCHGTFGSHMVLCNYLGVPTAETEMTAAGLNHLTWIHHLTWKGQDLLETLADDTNPGAQRFAQDQPFSSELFHIYGAVPVPYDRHVTEFYPQFFTDGQYCGKTLGVDVFSVEETIEGGEAGYNQMRELAVGNAPIPEEWFHRAPGEHEQFVAILVSIQNDAGEVYYANTPNRGIIPDLPDEAILELPTRFHANGCRAELPRPLPRGVLPVIARRSLQQELNMQAALKGDRNLALQALLDDGWVASVDSARAMMQELLEAQANHLPRFAF
jgi:alpha-galactosidase